MTTQSVGKPGDISIKITPWKLPKGPDDKFPMTIEISGNSKEVVNQAKDIALKHLEEIKNSPPGSFINRYA